MEEIDPVFLETSYYVVPGPSSAHSYGLFFRALTETKYAALAKVAMHGREHVMVIRAGNKGLIAHTMFYVNEVRATEEFTVDSAGVVGKELDLAKKFVEAIADTFRPEEFTDKYREQLEALLASKEAVPLAGVAPTGTARATGKVVDIMEALRKSLNAAQSKNADRKPATAAASDKKTRKRLA